MDMSNGLPKILLCTPELTFWPGSESVSIKRFGRTFQHFRKKRKFQKIGGLADITSTLAIELKQKGVHIAIALPHIRAAAEPELADLIDRQIENLGSAGISHWKHNLFLIQHDYFNNINRIYEGDGILFSLTLQRLILNALIPKLKPALIHTHDWPTGFIGPLSHPDIKSLHTIHNFYTKTVPMSLLYNFRLPLYNANKLFLGEGFNHNRVDFQLSGIFGSDYINTPSQGWLSDIVSGRVPSWTNPRFIEQVRNKFESLRAFSVLNAPDPSYAPEIDSSIYDNFSLENIFDGKKINKRKFQKEMWLRQDKNAPLIVWTNRADPHQKGIQFLDQILPGLMQDYQNPELQMAIISDGVYIPKIKRTIHDLEDQGFRGRMAIRAFSDELERTAYAAGDALLNCSSYAPCELVQMKGPKYGCLPIVRWVGGLKDTVLPIAEGGYGIVFDDYDANALHHGINEFLSIYHGNPEFHKELVIRTKQFADTNFTVSRMADGYIAGYERILGRKVHE